jgi:Family of unknown function (DUF5343)
MALPSAYLTSFKNVDAILAAIKAAQAPPRFTQRFLEGLGFQNSNDRLFINVLKALGFLNDTGEPRRRYHEYLDLTQSETVLAEAIREAYADLFRVNNHAENMSNQDVKNKMKTLSEGQYTDRVLTQNGGDLQGSMQERRLLGCRWAGGSVGGTGATPPLTAHRSPGRMRQTKSAFSLKTARRESGD